jgi:hypothetical protein
MSNLLRLALAATLATTSTGCLDSFLEPACGSYMYYDPEVAACLCDDNAIPVPLGCQPCAADEVVVGTQCACPPGQTKDAADLCVAVPGLGDTCDETHPCTDAVYDTCAETSVDAYTCTHACGIDDDCPAAYTCADWESAPYCREFTGVGNACAGPADCAGLDADFCAQGLCVVDGCTVGVEECPRGMACCDLSEFGIGTLCIPPEYCP